MNDVLFAICLLISAVLVASGVAMVHVPTSLIVGGLLLAVVSWLVLGEVER